MSDLMIIMWWMCFIGGIVVGIMFANVILKSIRSSSSNLCILLSASLFVAQSSSAEFTNGDSNLLVEISGNTRQSYVNARNVELAVDAGNDTLWDIKNNTVSIIDELVDVKNHLNTIKSDVSDIETNTYNTSNKLETTNTRLLDVKNAILNKVFTFDDINIVNSIAATNSILSTIRSKIDTTNSHLSGIDTKLAGVENSTFETAANTLAANTLLASIDAELVTLNAAMSGGVTTDNSAVVAAIGTTNSLLTGIAAGNDIRNYTLDELKSLNTTAVAHLDYLKTIGNAIQYNTYITRTETNNKIQGISDKLTTLITNSDEPSGSSPTGPNKSLTPFPVLPFTDIDPSMQFNGNGAYSGSAGLVTKHYVSDVPSPFDFSMPVEDDTDAPVWHISLPMSQLNVGGFSMQDHNWVIDFGVYDAIRSPVHAILIAFMGFFSMMRIFDEFRNA